MSAKLRHRVSPDRTQIPASAEGFLRELQGPTAFGIAGRDRSRARVVVTLLHGNEPSGLRAVHAWLRSQDTPAVDTWCVLGNVEAARMPPGFAHRMLSGRRDLNRCFLGPRDDEDGALAEEILELIREVAPEAVVDLHNNSGHNPAYGVGVQRDPRTLALVAKFARRFVLSHLNLGALMEAIRHLPSTTIEVGRAGDPEADRVALLGLNRFLSSDDVFEPAPDPASMQVLVTPMRVCVRPDTKLAFAGEPVRDADLTIALDLDRHNFRVLPADTPIGWATRDRLSLELIDEDGVDRADEWFARREDLIVVRRPLIPIMITTDPGIAVSDCLFYVVRED